MSRAITKKQQAVLDFIKSNVAEHGFPPSMREISDAFGWKSVNAAQEHLQRLQAKGFIFLGGSARAITIIGEEKPAPEEMAGALRVIATLASFDVELGHQKALDPKHVLDLCNKALGFKQAEEAA